MSRSDALKRIDYLADSIKDNPIPMAVVDYLGRVDADGLVDVKSDLFRRYGVRDLRHVFIYDLKVVQLNPAGEARMAELQAQIEGKR